MDIIIYISNTPHYFTKFWMDIKAIIQGDPWLLMNMK
jgi:hypothetical protein